MTQAILDKLDQVSTVIAQVRADLAASVQPIAAPPTPQAAAEPVPPTPPKKPKRKPAPPKRRKSPR